MNIAKPILKWVGGKTQIIDKIISEFPPQINNYHEIFLGGGSVLFALLSYKKANMITVTGTINAYDLNEPLIHVYKNIQSAPNELFNEIQKTIMEYNACADEPAKSDYYYRIRGTYNGLSPDEKKTIVGSALFIFLNKTCFRGVFRIGPNGFNVPYGNYVKPEIINREHLNEIHELIQGVNFVCADFETSINPQHMKENDFVYLDPPYAPENKLSFVKYTENGFGHDKHVLLFEKVKELNNFLMSNSDVLFVRESFPENVYEVESVLCKRSINSKKPESKTNEVIIKRK